MCYKVSIPLMSSRNTTDLDWLIVHGKNVPKGTVPIITVSPAFGDKDNKMSEMDRTLLKRLLKKLSIYANMTFEIYLPYHLGNTMPETILACVVAARIATLRCTNYLSNYKLVPLCGISFAGSLMPIDEWLLKAKKIFDKDEKSRFVVLKQQFGTLADELKSRSLVIDDFEHLIYQYYLTGIESYNERGKSKMELSEDVKTLMKELVNGITELATKGAGECKITVKPKRKPKTKAKAKVVKLKPKAKAKVVKLKAKTKPKAKAIGRPRKA